MIPNIADFCHCVAYLYALIFSPFPHRTNCMLVSARAKIQACLEQLPRNQIILVRYLPTHDPTYDWIYNRAGLDPSKVIWAGHGQRR